MQIETIGCGFPREMDGDFSNYKLTKKLKLSSYVIVLFPTKATSSSDKVPKCYCQEMKPWPDSVNIYHFSILLSLVIYNWTTINQMSMLLEAV